MTKEVRPAIPCRVAIAVWAAAAGRCTLCNQVVTENEDLGEVFSIGELAHNVGWGLTSPRGDSPLDDIERNSPENLILLCRNCHRPIDQDDAIARYTPEKLYQFKHEHETRVRLLTEIGADRQATVLRLVGRIRGANPELSYDSVLTATTAEGYFPVRLPDIHRNAFEINLRDLPEVTAEDFVLCAAQMDRLLARIDDGIKEGAITRLAVFGFARIPLLVHLGARLGDKVPTLIFQRQRTDEGNSWRWPRDPGPPPVFAWRAIKQYDDASPVAVIINISGCIHTSELPRDIRGTHTIYEIAPELPASCGPTIISGIAALASFESTLRAFLAHLERTHGRLQCLAVFSAIPLSCAVTLGRVLMPQISPKLVLFERDEHKLFFQALEVQR